MRSLVRRIAENSGTFNCTGPCARKIIPPSERARCHCRLCVPCRSFEFRQSRRRVEEAAQSLLYRMYRADSIARPSVELTAVRIALEKELQLKAFTHNCTAHVHQLSLPAEVTSAIRIYGARNSDVLIDYFFFICSVFDLECTHANYV